MVTWGPRHRRGPYPGFSLVEVYHPVFLSLDVCPYIWYNRGSMAQQTTTSGLRRKIAELQANREELERTLVRRRRMLDACLVEKYGLAGGKRRRSPAYYLSRKVRGRTTLDYVPKGELARIRRATDAWREFSSTMAQWVKLHQRLERCMRELGRAQVVSSPGSSTGGECPQGGR